MSTLMTGYKHVTEYVFNLWRQPHWWAENWSAIVMIGWSLVSLLGRPLSDRTSYAALTTVASSEVWEGLALGAGILQLGMLIINYRWGRMGAAALCAWFFSFVLVSFVRENNMPPAISLYAGFVGINLMAMYRLARGAG